MVHLGGFGLALQLAAKDRGIDSIVAYELSKYHDILKKYAKIQDDEDICAAIAFGYENEQALNKFRSKKNTLEEVCSFVK